MEDSMITVLGLGSLLSEASARQTCPNLKNFRLATIDGWRRSFNKTDSGLIKRREIPTDGDLKYGCLSAIRDEKQQGMIVSVFEISQEEWAPLVIREYEYKLEKVPFVDIENRAGEGILCIGDFMDDDECEALIYSDPLRVDRWEDFKKAYPNMPMWQYDVLPYQRYLDMCLEAAQEHGDSVYENFLDTTFTGQGVSMRDYIGIEG